MTPRHTRLTMMAGWLFADLFLVLLIAGLGAIPANTAASHKQPGKPTPTPTASPTPTAPVHNVGLDPHHIDFTINLSPASFRAGAGNRLLDEVNAKLAQLDASGRMVGFVLVFATGDLQEVGLATQTATRVYRLLHSHSHLFGLAQGLGYWGGSGSDFQFKVFLLNQ